MHGNGWRQGGLMAQEVGSQDAGPQAGDPQPAEREPGKRRSAWPWIALAVLILIVLLLLWWYWRTPEDGAVTVVKKTEIAVTPPPAQPEPAAPVSTAPATQTTDTRFVPDVLGDPADRAKRKLDAAGYVAATSYVFTTSKATGLVQEQSPAGGTELEPGKTVNIVVTTGGNDAVQVRVPKLVGLTRAAAEEKIKAAGLVPVISYGTTAEKGTVQSQWPLGGDTLPEGGEVQIQVVP